MTTKLFLSFCLISSVLVVKYYITQKKCVYKVTRLSEPININAIWEKEPWKDIPALNISNHMGDMPEDKPKVQAKVAYDEKKIYIIFRVKDQYVRCVNIQYQSSVYKDSCVEFFFTPSSDVSKGYFNLEMNCIGTTLFKFHDTVSKRMFEISQSDFSKVEIAHSIPSVVDPEVKGPVIWTIEYSIPFSILAKYFDLLYPASGIKWKANFYKIANKSSHPHWITWAKINLPEPDFHQPKFFGTLKF